MIVHVIQELYRVLVLHITYVKQLTPIRPLRPLSGHLKLKNTLSVAPGPPSPSLDDADSPSTTPTTPTPPTLLSRNGEGDYDEPPPLPEKQQHSDYANLMESPKGVMPGKTRVNSAMARIGTSKNKEKVVICFCFDLTPV